MVAGMGKCTVVNSTMKSTEGAGAATIKGTGLITVYDQGAATVQVGGWHQSSKTIVQQPFGNATLFTGVVNIGKNRLLYCCIKT